MGLFSKIGRAFVEPVPGENLYPEVSQIEDGYNVGVTVVDETTEVELEKVNTETLIDDIYSQNELGDKSCSIFKVDELISSLPKEMPTKTKHSSVLAILESFGLSANDIVSDGKQRATVLDAAKNKIDEECMATIAEKENKIEELRQEIELLHCDIVDESEKMKKSDEVISDEMSKIVYLIDFVGGEK